MTRQLQLVKGAFVQEVVVGVVTSSVNGGAMLIVVFLRS